MKPKIDPCQCPTCKEDSRRSLRAQILNSCPDCHGAGVFEDERGYVNCPRCVPVKPQAATVKGGPCDCVTAGVGVTVHEPFCISNASKRPWNLHPRVAQDEPEIYSDGCTVATVNTSAPDPNERIANAALIVSAVNAFEGLKGRVTELETVLTATLRALEQHLEDETVETRHRQYPNIKQADVCPCWDNEVKQAREALKGGGK